MAPGTDRRVAMPDEAMPDGGPESSGFVCLKGYDNVFKPTP